jgi:RNA polymerase sigma factor (sigma-70 family)
VTSPPFSRARSTPPAGASGIDEADRSAKLDALFRDESPALMRYFRSKLRYREDAADLLQEVFARASRLSICDFDNPAAYLQRIASNLVFDQKRVVAHRQAHVPADDVHLLDPSPSPLSQLEAKEMLARLDAALARLRPKTRQVFLLSRVEGLTYPKIAERLGVSVSAVEKHMMIAIAHLDRRLRRR